MKKKNDYAFGYLSDYNLNKFSRESFRRGERYYDDDKVSLTYEDSLRGEYHANVKGSSAYNVRLDLSPSTGEIKKAYCNCPFQGMGYCKHIAATLLAVSDSYPLESEEKPLPHTGSKETNNFASLDEARESLFSIIKKNIESGKSKERDLPYLLLSCFMSLKERFRLNTSEAITKELSEIESNFSLGEDIASALFENLSRLYSGTSRWKFYTSALNNKLFHKAAFASFMKESVGRNAYDFRSFLYNDEFKHALLEKSSDEELSSFLSSYLASSIMQDELIEEIKRRKAYPLFLSYAGNLNYARGQEFYFKMGKIAESEDKVVAKALYRKMLFSYDLTLPYFLYYYHFLNEDERENEKKDFSTAGRGKGFEAAFGFLFKKETSLIRYFSLEHFAYMAKEIKECGRPSYEKYLIKAIETTLNKGGKMKEESENQLFLVFRAYDEDIFKRYFLDERVKEDLVPFRQEEYFRLLYERSLLEEAHYLKWEE